MENVNYYYSIHKIYYSIYLLYIINYTVFIKYIGSYYLLQQ